jgi:hypothetical protein
VEAGGPKIIRRKGDKMTKKTILWAMVVLVAFVSGFGVGAALWEFDAYNYIRGETTIGSDTLSST